MAPALLPVTTLWALATRHLAPADSRLTLCKLEFVDQAELDRMARKLTGSSSRVVVADLPLCKQCANTDIQKRLGGSAPLDLSKDVA